jgi:hypothetical protein
VSDVAFEPTRKVSALLTHAPRPGLPVNVYNLYGHVHNNAIRPEDDEYYTRNPERKDDDYSFIAGPDRDWYINCCVEVIDYTPRSLDWLINNNRKDVTP